MVVVHQCKCSSSIILYHSVPLSTFHLWQALEHANNENHQLVWCHTTVCEREREKERSGKARVPHLSCQPSHSKELNQDEAHQLTAFKWVIASESLHSLVEEFEREMQECLEETANVPLSLIFIVCFFLSVLCFLMVPRASVRIRQRYCSRFPSFTPTCLFCYCNNAVFRQQCHYMPFPHTELQCFSCIVLWKPVLQKCRRAYMCCWKLLMFRLKM